MKKLFKRIFKNWILIWLLAATVLLISFVAYAEYLDKHNRVSRVVANTGQVETYFTSDYLYPQDPVAHSFFFTLNDALLTCEESFRLRNYDPTSPAKFYNKNLTYTLVAKLVKKDGSDVTAGDLGSYKIGIKRDTDESYTYFDESHYTIIFPLTADDYFAGTAKEEKVFNLSFDRKVLEDAPNLYVKLVATPSDGHLDTLQAILGVTALQADLSQGWSGKFNDNTSRMGYDGFNYVISGNGAATIKFGWRTDRFEANQFVLTDMDADIAATTTETIGGKEWKFIYVTANANDTFENSVLTRAGIGRYDIQLFMTGNADTDYADWSTIESYVTIDTHATLP